MRNFYPPLCVISEKTIDYNDFFLICDDSIYQIVKNGNKLDMIYFCEIKKFKDILIIDAMVSLTDLNKCGYLLNYCIRMFHCYSIMDRHSIEFYIQNNGNCNKLPNLLEYYFDQNSVFCEKLHHLIVPHRN